MAKNTAQSAKNNINVTKTISERQQMRSVSIYYRGMFNFCLYELPELVQTKYEMTEDTTFIKDLKCAMSDNDLVCNNIFVNNAHYKNGDIVIVKIEDCDSLVVGLVKTILVKENKVYFVCQCYNAVRNFMQFFECEKPQDDVFEFVETSKIVDFKPLIMRGTTKKFVFTLHHHISFDYA